MIRSQWRAPTYAGAVASNDGDFGGVRSPGNNGNNVNRRYGVSSYSENQGVADMNAILRDDRIGAARMSKFIFQQRIKMEERRSRLAAGNIVTYLLPENKEHRIPDKRKYMNQVLRASGFKPTEVESVKINEYRGNQVEVLVREGVEWDLGEIDRKLKEAKLDVSVGKFLDKEEIVSIFGLPLTSEVEKMKGLILETILPFVKEVKEIKATVHSSDDDDDFFSGRFDGNYKIKVVPAADPKVQIPNFIVVDKEHKVQAKVVYNKQIHERRSMCLNCYSEYHFRQSPECEGPKEWIKYVPEFEARWGKASEEKAAAGGELEERDSDEGFTENRFLNKVRVMHESLESEQGRREAVEKEMEELMDKMRELEEKNSSLEAEKAAWNSEREILENTVEFMNKNVTGENEGDGSDDMSGEEGGLEEEVIDPLEMEVGDGEDLDLGKRKHKASPIGKNVSKFNRRDYSDDRYIKDFKTLEKGKYYQFKDVDKKTGKTVTGIFEQIVIKNNEECIQFRMGEGVGTYQKTYHQASLKNVELIRKNSV